MHQIFRINKLTSHEICNIVIRKIKITLLSFEIFNKGINSNLSALFANGKNSCCWLYSSSTMKWQRNSKFNVYNSFSYLIRFHLHTAPFFREIPMISEVPFASLKYCLSTAISTGIRLSFLKLCATTQTSLMKQSKISG